MSEEKKEEILDQEKQLDESELDEVAGGATCACAVSGGGRATIDGEETCVCVVAGAGMKRIGYRNPRTGEWVDFDEPAARCICPLAGGGTEL